MPTTRAGVIDALAKKCALSNAQLDEALTALQEVLEESLSAGEPVRIPGLFAVERITRAERVGSHPRTGELLTIAARYGAKITLSAALKRAAASSLVTAGVETD